MDDEIKCHECKHRNSDDSKPPCATCSRNPNQRQFREGVIALSRPLRAKGDKVIPTDVARNPFKLLKLRKEQGWRRDIGMGFTAEEIHTLHRGKVVLHNAPKHICKHCDSEYEESIRLTDMNLRELEQVCILMAHLENNNQQLERNMFCFNIGTGVSEE
jgi:hypothetical protein